MATPSSQEPTQDSEEAKTKNGKAHYVALFLLSITSAWAAGRMIGITQYDSVVIAAVVPVLLTAGWGIIALKFANVNNKNRDVNLVPITFAMIVFLYIMTISANSSRHDEEKREREHLENCSNYEHFTNEARDALELPPLDSSYFCKK